MCDPFSALAMVGSMASSFMSYSQQASLMEAQDAANASWVSYQQDKSRQEWARQEQMRQRAEFARQESLKQLAPEEQKKTQETEQTRLETTLTPQDLAVNEQLAGDKLLSGQKGAAESVKADIASRVTQASRDARDRIAALAALTSYGGSQGGLQTKANEIFRISGQEIAQQGNIRQGSLGAYGVEKQVEPRRMVMKPSPWGAIAGGLASIAGKGMGNSFGGSF